MVATTLTAKAVNWIKEQKDKPFFLYFPTTNIHHPFTPHPRFKGTSACGPYGDFVQELDWIVGQILTTLDNLNLTENTLVIFSSDNGGMLNDEGLIAWKYGHRMNGDLFGFKFDVWEGGQRVPFIVRWPGKVLAASRSNQLLINVDMMATFASIFNYTLKENEGKDSYNMLPAFLGNPNTQIRDHAVMAGVSLLGLRQGKWMYIEGQGGGGFKDYMNALLLTNQKNSDIENGAFKKDAPKKQLYDLQNDFKQTENLYHKYPAVVKAMSGKLEKIKLSK